jgi:transposase
MRKIREVLRLKTEKGLANRAIARACGIGPASVSRYLEQAERVGLVWPLPEELDDAALDRLLYPPPPGPDTERPLPDFVEIHTELKRKEVTLQLLWHEYHEVHPTGYRYSQFCEHYRRWAGRLNPSMRQVHRAGEKAFVDYAGTKPNLTDPKTGELIPVELFVGVLGASSYTYAEASESQDLASWTSSHERMLQFFDGSPEIWVPDNLKSGVTTPCRYEPEINRSYAEMARHYGAVVIPARVGRPKDKPKVEAAVLLAERWIVAALRKRIFFSLAELNQAIREKLVWLNERPMRVMGVSRRELYERLDRPALKPLPQHRFELAEWKKCRINIDYHVEIDFNYYSVPHQLLSQGPQLEACVTSSTVEILHRDKRVATHPRLRGRGRHSTLFEHMPSSHRAHAEWTPSRLIAWAQKTGPATGRVVAEILRSRPHPEQGFRSCLGILRLGKRSGDERLEAACLRAEGLGSYSFKTIKNILHNGLDRLPFDQESKPARPRSTHDNIRGAAYYTAKETNAETTDV